MTLCSLSYGRENISFKVLHRARKTLAIEVFPDSSVIIKAPIGTSLEEIRNRVFKRARWIIRQQQYFQQFDPRTPQRMYIGGETHLYLGRQFRLKISEGMGDTVKLTRGFFLVEARGGAGDSEKVRSLLDRWYAEKAAITFQDGFERCWPYFEKLGLSRPRIQVRQMKKRWGSLSRGGMLTLNTDLIRAPRECIEYVITHELCHLKHHDHSSEFYRLLEKVMPDWEKRKHRMELALV